MGIKNLDNIIFGIHPILEALRSGKKLERLYVSRGRKGNAIPEILHLAKSQGVDVRFEPWERLRSRVGNETSHQGIVGIIEAYSYVAFEDKQCTNTHNEYYQSQGPRYTHYFASTETINHKRLQFY